MMKCIVYMPCWIDALYFILFHLNPQILLILQKNKELLSLKEKQIIDEIIDCIFFPTRC